MRMLRYILLATVLSAGPAPAQPDDQPYSVDWHTLTAGGTTFAEGGAYRLGGATGQPDAGLLAAGSYQLQGGFWISAVAQTLDIPPRDTLIPNRFTAFAPAPNPSRGDVGFAFELPAASNVRVTLHDLNGRLIRTLLDGHRGVGRHTAMWDGADNDGRHVPAGMYFAQFLAGENTATHRFVRLD